MCKENYVAQGSSCVAEVCSLGDKEECDSNADHAKTGEKSCVIENSVGSWGECKVKECNSGFTLNNEACECTPTTTKELVGGTQCLDKCRVYEERNNSNVCVTKTCGSNETLNFMSGECECPSSTHEVVNGACVAKCPSSQERVGGTCVAKCPSSQERNESGNCVPSENENETGAAIGQVVFTSRCGSSSSSYQGKAYDGSKSYCRNDIGSLCASGYAEHRSVVGTCVGYGSSSNVPLGGNIGPDPQGYTNRAWPYSYQTCTCVASPNFSECSSGQEKVSVESGFGLVVVTTRECRSKCSSNQYRRSDGACITLTCPINQERVNGTCVQKCANNQKRSSGVCYPLDGTWGNCGTETCGNEFSITISGTIIDEERGACITGDRQELKRLVRQSNGKYRTCKKTCTCSRCQDNQERVNGVCVNRCSSSQERVNGVCVSRSRRI